MTVSNYVNSTWSENNRYYLMQAIARIKFILEQKNQQSPSIYHNFIYHHNNGGSSGKIVKFEAPAPLAPSNLSPVSSLEHLCQTFKISSFERDLLLLCAGMEMDRSWSSLIAKITQDSRLNYPCFAVALATLPEPFWLAITPNATLRRWRMIEIEPGKTLTHSQIHIDEGILHYLWGIHQTDQRLLPMVEPLPKVERLARSHQEIADKIAAVLLSAERGQFPVVQLCGSEVATRIAIACAACDQLGINLQVISAEALVSDISKLDLIKRLWERESILTSSALLFNCDFLEDISDERVSKIGRFIETIDSPVIVSDRVRRISRQRLQIIFDIAQPTIEEQRLIWRDTLSKSQFNYESHIDHLVSHFNLSASAIGSIGLQVEKLADKNPEDFINSPSISQHPLWDICRSQARLNLDNLAERIDTVADWDDLILPEKELNTLREIAVHVRQRTQVYESWGFMGKSNRGLGISALFSGQSGTGKTMSAEVLGSTLKLDVYRIDLSAIVSKYIGETEKNLRRVFDVAEGGGAILLFDEADALFGKRSDVKDSHDRYANMEVSYLLQRMESYRGLAILTTNLKSSIDQAFLRRLRFVVQFPFPDATHREEIWKRIFPQKTPTANLDFKKLSNLNVAGGNIRNIAINAAFLAAEANESVMMKHILQAAKTEYVKLERPMTDNEVRGWT